LKNCLDKLTDGADIPLLFAFLSKMSFPSSSPHAALYAVIAADKSLWTSIHSQLRANGWTPSTARRLVRLVRPDWRRGTYDQNMRLLLNAHVARPGHNFDFCGLSSFLPEYKYVWTRTGQSEVCRRFAYTPWRYVTETLGYTELQAIAYFSAQRRSTRLIAAK
jgi:hypothetical protein